MQKWEEDDGGLWAVEDVYTKPTNIAQHFHSQASVYSTGTWLQLIAKNT